MDDQLLYSITQAQAQLGGLGRSKVYEEIAAGRLRTVKIGSRIFFSRAALEEYVSLLPSSTTA